MTLTDMPIDYTNLFHHLPVAFIVFGVDDPTFTIVEENDRHAEIAMVDRDATVGRPLLDVFPDTSEDYLKHGHSMLLESIRRVIATGKPDAMPHLHYDLKDPEGNMQPRYWSVVHYPIMKDGRVVAVCQETNDITEETLTQRNFDNTQYQLNQILQAGNIGTWVWNVDTKMITVDANAASFLGLDPVQGAKGISTDEFTKAVHADDRSRMRREFAAAIKNHSQYELEYRTIDAKGETHWLVARGTMEPRYRQAQFSPGILIDITDRKRVEESLKFLTSATAQFSASLNYRTTLNSIAGMVVPTIADWCSIELVEDHRLRQVAITHKDPRKVKWAKALREKQGDTKLDEQNAAAQVVRTGEPLYLPDIPEELIRETARSEEELQILLELGFSSAIIVPMKLDNEVIGVLSLISTESGVHYKVSDIELAQTVANRAALAVYNATLYQEAKRELRERRQLQEDLELLNDQLEARVGERTQQLQETNDGLKREIRKRHAAERALDKYVKELARSNQELQDFAYVASHDLQEPLRKIQAFGDLLESEFAGGLSDNGRQYLNRMRSAAARMSTLIQDLLAFSRVTIKAQPYVVVNLNTVVAEAVSDLDARVQDTGGQVEVGELPTVWADTTHMRQLFQNLIGNALKFHKPGVAPVVKVYAKPRKATDTMHTICVEDNGIGFDEKYVDRIFAVFQRLHGRDEYEGTGIGLAVCRKIAERYGGTITATSKQGSGTTFIFKIPISGKEPAA